MESGGDSSSQEDRAGRMPPDEQDMRLGRARVSRGFDAPDDSRAVDGTVASSELIGGGTVEGDQATAASRYASPPGTPTDTADPAARFRPWSETSPAAAGPTRCEFLRSVGPDGRLTEAQRTAVPTHRCAAFGDPLPLSLRQQELVCLQRVHVSCPRYVRGTLLANENPTQPVAEERRVRGIPILNVVGFGLVTLAVGILIAAMFGLPPLGGSHGLVAAATSSPTPVASVQDSAAPSAAVTASPVVVASATPNATPLPSPTAKATPSPTPVASATWPPGATASRMNLLTPCTGQANCYLYTVRGPGQNGSSVADDVAGIARFFGVDVNAIYTLNPGSNAGITPGQQLKIPPPTR